MPGEGNGKRARPAQQKVEAFSVKVEKQNAMWRDLSKMVGHQPFFFGFFCDCRDKSHCVGSGWPRTHLLIRLPLPPSQGCWGGDVPPHPS